jgi:hypothetical protein
MLSTLGSPCSNRQVMSTTRLGVVLMAAQVSSELADRGDRPILVMC